MLSRIAEWINDAIFVFFNGMLNDLINLASNGIVSMNSMALGLMEMDYVRNTVLLVQAIAGALMVVRIAYHSLTTYILYQSGDDSADPKKLLFEAFTGTALVTATPWLAIWVFSLGSALASDIANIISFQSQDTSLISLVLGSTFSFVLIALIAVVLLLLIYIQAAVRAVEVCLLAVMGPILAVGGLNNELFSAWWKNLVVVSLTQAVQIFLLKGVFVSIGMTNHEVGPYFFLILGFLWVTWKSPNVLKEYAYSSGTGQAIGGAAQQAGSYVLMRRMLTRV